MPPEKSGRNEILNIVKEAEEASIKRKAAMGVETGHMSAQMEA